MAIREMGACGYPKGGSIDWPVFVETKNVFCSRLKSTIGISAARFLIFTIMCCYLPQLLLSYSLPFCPSIHLYFASVIFSMVPGKVSDRTFDWPWQLLCLGQVFHALQTIEQSTDWLSQFYHNSSSHFWAGRDGWLGKTWLI